MICEVTLLVFSSAILVSRAVDWKLLNDIKKGVNGNGIYNNRTGPKKAE